jgi:hypothetical protein
MKHHEPVPEWTPDRGGWGSWFPFVLIPSECPHHEGREKDHLGEGQTEKVYRMKVNANLDTDGECSEAICNVGSRLLLT